MRRGYRAPARWVRHCGRLYSIATVLLCHACAAPTSQLARRPAAQLPGEVASAQLPSHTPRKHSAAGLVEESLHARGIRFGTDGSLGALYAFVQGDFARIPAERARDGDVILFRHGRRLRRPRRSGRDRGACPAESYFANGATGAYGTASPPPACPSPAGTSGATCSIPF